MARILVVDDTPQNLKLIELYLRETEFEVVAVTSGHDAIEQSMQGAFDMILLDVVMPGIDGFEVCRRLKNDPRTAFVPVIFLTGRMGDESDKLAAYKLGAVDYIQKPVDRQELIARIRVMLRLEEARSRLDRENAALRGQLTRSEQQLEEFAAEFEGLKKLSKERSVDQVPSVLTLSPEMAIRSFDESASRILGDLSVGMALATVGAVAGRVVEIVESGVASAPLSSDAGDEEFLLVIRRLESGDLLLCFWDVTSERRVQRGIADRALLDLLPESTEQLTESAYRMTDFMGNSQSVLATTDKVARLREKRSTVLIYGESGSGKELVARALHFDGRYRNTPFIPLHCGAIAPELIESELFGHEKGAFTGAQSAHAGLFRAADGGTIFLDEIAETSPSVQVKLLRVLQRGEIRPVGASQPRIVDVRIIAATNRDLLELVREGKFREDLYYRLEVVTLHLPSLRERIDDVQLLAEHFIRVGNRNHERAEDPVRGFSEGAMERLKAYSWPGNVRELENVIEGAFALDVGSVVRESDLPDRILRDSSGSHASQVKRSDPLPAPVPFREQGVDLRGRREAAERDAIIDAIRDTNGDKAAAAQQLGMARSTFYRRLKELGI